MRTVIVASLSDPAGTNIKERLLENYGFEESGEYFSGSPVYELGDLTLVCSSKEIIFGEGLDEKFGEGVRYAFISRHRAESGIPSLTAHFTGNFGDAAFGGTRGEIAKFSPSLLKNYMVSLSSKRAAVHSGHTITLEATHHGPTSLKSSVLFVELGSSEPDWKDPKPAGFVAESLMEAIKSEKRYEECGIGIGGTHYPEKLNRIETETEIALGPIIPKYALPSFDERILGQMVRKGDQEIGIAIIDQKGLGKFKERVMRVLDGSGVEKMTV